MTPTKPRVLLVGRTRYQLPLNTSLRRKFDALSERMELRVVGSAVNGSNPRDPMFRLVGHVRPHVVDGLAFHLALPARIASELRQFQPDVVVVQGAHETAAVLLSRVLVGSHARIILDLHGDWRVATRLYGSRARRLLNPVADRLATLAVRHADGVRTVSDYTTMLVREAGAEPAGVFPAFMDHEPFLQRPPEPLPERPVALFVGVLELYKNIDGLAAAWRLAAPRVPGAELRIVGKGSKTKVVEKLVRDLPEQTRWTPALPRDEIVGELDHATCLVLPSRREGMGRVAVEALCRGRPVLGASTGGIPELVHDGENGILVDPEDTNALADALVRVLSDRGLAERLAAAARPSVERALLAPDEYADLVGDLVAAVRTNGKTNGKPRIR